MQQYDFRPLIADIHAFTKAGGITIRNYQKPAVDAIVDSVLNRRGLRFCLMFPRQTGKNEIQAQVENYLLFRFSEIGGNIIKISPTWKPQSINAKERFKTVTKRNEITAEKAEPSQGFMYVMNNSKLVFLSGDPNSSIVGQTASLLLEIDEAQDIGKNKFDKEIAPMAASTNATIVFYGTAWTKDTLLHREYEFCLQMQKTDGIRRVFRLTCEDIFPDVPAYKIYVMGEIAKMGRDHPTIKTQYFSEEIDAESAFLPDAAALLAGNHEKRETPEEGHIYAIMIDVAGGEEENKAGKKLETDENQKRDATAVTICDIDLSTLSTVKHGATWKVMCRYNWTGLKQTEQYARLEGLINIWCPYVCIDATGIGGGLADFLENLVPAEKLIKFKFTVKTKSDMGWAWIAMAKLGRWKEYKENDALQNRYYEQLKYCKYEVIPGPGNMMRFAVPDGTRNENGEYVHDDLIMSACMSAVIEEKVGGSWMLPADTLIVEAADPLKEMRKKW